VRLIGALGDWREHECHRDLISIPPVDLGTPGMSAFNDEADTFIETPRSHIFREHVKFDALDAALARPRQGCLHQEHTAPQELSNGRAI
jgi:hypothetical protein